MNQTSVDEHHETRLINRRCRCGKPLAEMSNRCEWHGAGSARYAADLLAYIKTPRCPPWKSWPRVAARLIKDKLKQGATMHLYMFEYVDREGNSRTTKVQATNSSDAFNAFRADHPYVPIADVWVEFGAR
jgi:hypothetical protein